MPQYRTMMVRLFIILRRPPTQQDYPILKQSNTRRIHQTYSRYEARILSPVLETTKSSSTIILFGATTSKLQFLNEKKLISRLGDLLLLQ